MKKGKCIKCGSGDISKKTALGYRGCMSISFFSVAFITDYVCTRCGYFESYVEDSKKLEQLRLGMKKG